MLKAKSLKHQTIQKYQTIVGSGVLTPPPPPLFYEDPLLYYLAPHYPFLNFIQPPFPVTSNSHPYCSFCCLVSLADWLIAPHLMCYFTSSISCNKGSSLLCLTQCDFLLLLWFDTAHTNTFDIAHTNTHTRTQRHKDTQYTQGQEDWHSPI